MLVVVGVFGMFRMLGVPGVFGVFGCSGNLCRVARPTGRRQGAAQAQEAAGGGHKYTGCKGLEIL